MKTRLRTKPKDFLKETSTFSSTPSGGIFESRPFVPSNTRKQTPGLSTASTSSMFDSRPFVVQSQTAENVQQPDIKTSLIRAEQYGHDLGRIPPKDVSITTQVQPKMAKGQSQESDQASSSQVIQAAPNLKSLSSVFKELPLRLKRKRNPDEQIASSNKRAKTDPSPDPNQQRWVVDQHETVRRINPHRQVAEYMRGSQRTAETMTLPSLGEKREKGYLQTSISTQRDILAAGARHVRRNSGEFQKQQLVDGAGNEIGKVYPAIFGGKRPDDAARNPGGKTPVSNLRSGQSKANKTDYGKKDDNNIYGTKHYKSQSDEFRLRRGSVSISEMNRAMGAGAGQLLAESSGFTQSVSRDEAYGTKNKPGRIPATYKGSQKDIINTESAALKSADEKMLDTPFGQQIDFQLNFERNQRKQPLTRRASNPEIFASSKQQQEETERALLSTGFSKEDVRRTRRGSLQNIPEYLRENGIQSL
ncbi:MULTISPECIES: hypothetical protein [unclassified Nostoc]|uniref:hypothetical protein n=1 Tax=unclassified Nostoc TaxID=2593658 RepID=UPI00262FC59D|nr:hypothetical protein [Nostoc sp. S13]MDF5735978.1 hypothetical protein [Nostoc sp. S13]